ncbi:MAG: hypothetical protein K2K63_09750 [Acetatifactor sp.]|nr:hypothetical protein [Acetatifactor sp.]
MGRYMKALAGILVCMLFLTACGGGEEQEEGNRPLQEDIKMAERESPEESVSSEESESPDESDEPIESIAPEEDEASENSTDMRDDAAAVFDRLLEKGLYYITEYELDCLKEGASVQPVNWDEWQGQWARTGVVRSCSSYMTLAQTESEGHYADILSFYYNHNGSTKGELLFLDDTRAFFVAFDGEMTEDDPPQVVLLKLQDGLLTVVNFGPEYGCGIGVTVEGTYTKGTPEYTNANAMAENFTEEEQERIREFLETMGASYEESFADAVKYGCGESVWVTAEFKDGTTVTGKRYAGYYPTIGNLDLILFLAENGYTYWHQPGTGYLTDDPERAGLMTEDSRNIYSRLAEEGDYFPKTKTGRVTRKAGECTVTADFFFADETDFVADTERFVEFQLEGIWEGCGLSQSITMEIPYSNYYYYTALTVECRDINFDGYDDLAMVTGTAYGSGGNWQCCLGLIWNPANKMFEPMDSYPELQTDFDSERQRVVVRYRSGAGNEYVESYTLVDGAYQLTEMLHMAESFEPDRPEDYCLYHYVNGELADEHWVSDIYEAAELYPDLDYWWKG